MWILTDGSIIEQPEMEISSSGRRVRIKDKQETSVWQKDRDTIIQEAIETVVEDRECDILTCRLRRRAIEDDHTTLTPAQLNIGDRIEPITIVWQFRHPEMPLTAHIKATIRHTFRSNYEVGARLSFTEISDRSRHHPYQGECANGNWHLGEAKRTWSDREEAHRAQLFERYTDLFRNQHAQSEREALRLLRDLIDQFDALPSIDIPDARHRDIRWLTLNFEESNLDGELLTEIADFLNSEPIVEQLAETYEELRTLIHKLGIRMPERKPDDFQKALSVKGSDALVVALDPVNDNDIGHSLTLNLATGTIQISCVNVATDDDQLSDAWKLARFEAEIAGELTEFLNYCRSQSQKRHEVIETINTRLG